jgi:hypothetical protein
MNDVFPRKDQHPLFRDFYMLSPTTCKIFDAEWRIVGNPLDAGAVAEKRHSWEGEGNGLQNFDIFGNQRNSLIFGLGIGSGDTPLALANYI